MKIHQKSLLLGSSAGFLATGIFVAFAPYNVADYWFYLLLSLFCGVLIPFAEDEEA